MADQRRRAEGAAIRAAVSLISSAPYANLALWGGRVVHGLRFIAAAAEAALAEPDSSPAAPWPHAGMSPAHPVMGSIAPESSAAVVPVGGEPVPRADRILVLAPSVMTGTFGDQDVAARLNLCGPSPDSGRWVSVAFGGWVTPVAAAVARTAAITFAERHPTPDLLGLGSGWLLLHMEIAEAVVRTERACVLLDTEDSTALLSGGTRG